MPSRKPRTQRKMLYDMRLHMRHRLVSARLSKELRGKLKLTIRAMPLKKGDKVKVMRGSHKGKTGKITRVDISASKAYIEGIIVRKAKGGEVPVPLEPSNLLILEGNFEDKGRKKILERRKKGRG